MSPHGTGYWCDAVSAPEDGELSGAGERSMAASVAGCGWECGVRGGGVGSGGDGEGLGQVQSVAQVHKCAVDSH